MPVNAACLFYNKGVKLKMLKIAMWKLFYMVSQDDTIQSVSDLKGKKVVIPFRGDVPDTLFQYLCVMEKIDPEVLLRDEPFNSLDPGLRNRLHDYVLELTTERNITLLYVSHFPEDVLKVTNQVYVLKKEGQLEIVSQNRDQCRDERDYLAYLHFFIR